MRSALHIPILWWTTCALAASPSRLGTLLPQPWKTRRQSQKTEMSQKEMSKEEEEQQEVMREIRFQFLRPFYLRRSFRKVSGKPAMVEAVLLITVADFSAAQAR